MRIRVAKLGGDLSPVLFENTALEHLEPLRIKRSAKQIEPPFLVDSFLCLLVRHAGGQLLKAHRIEQLDPVLPPLPLDGLSRDRRQQIRIHVPYFGRRPAGALDHALKNLGRLRVLAHVADHDATRVLPYPSASFLQHWAHAVALAVSVWNPKP